MIWNSVKGLVLVIAAWLILNTINPALLKLNLDIKPVNITPPPGGGGTLGGGPAGVPMTEAQITEDKRIRDLLAAPNIGILINASPCTQGQVGGCTNLNGINQTLLNSVIDLRRAIGNTITITGGTESGHSGGSSHYTGNAIDLRFNPTMDAYIITNGGVPVQENLGLKYTVKINGRDVTFLKESAPPHWHME